jgi:hypothetical protein
VIAVLALAAVLYVSPTPSWTPGPDDPVCEAGQSVQVDHCAQGQLPGEVIGREIGPGTVPQPVPAVDPTSIVLVPTVADPTPHPKARTLAHTGVPTGPYLAMSGALIGAGVILRRRATRGGRAAD